MLRRLDRSPAFVAAFLALLCLPQASALVLQVARGFRPFGAAPARVPFSWDMFANRVERCGVWWDPALEIPGLGRVEQLKDIEPGIEWDVVFDHAESYRDAGLALCRFAGGRRVRLRCFKPDGSEWGNALECR